MTNVSNMDGTALVNAAVTFTCSYLSLIGSLLIIVAYAVARTKSTPKSAFLILHLAISDFFWFLAGAVMSTLWIANNGSVPDELCFIIAPTINFTRMTSLVWTVVISFNVYMSVKKRKWFWKSQEADWNAYRRKYFALCFLLGAPGTLVTIIQQHTGSNGLDGCSPGYEPLGEWLFVFFFELLPILVGFCCNVYVAIKIRHRMSKTAFPQSVRKRRKRVMYHYITICIVCWIPTILLYLLEICGLHLPILEIIARTSLYISGFFNFLVFGMQDPHLKRALDVVIYRLGLYSLCYGHDYYYLYIENSRKNQNEDGKTFVAVRGHSLKSSDVDKMVMFQEDNLSKNADKPKDRNSIYRNRKLSKEQKKELYAERPDLDPKFKIKRIHSNSGAGHSSNPHHHHPYLHPSHLTSEGHSEVKKKKKLIIHDNTLSTSPSESVNSIQTPLLLDDYENANRPEQPYSPQPAAIGGVANYQGGLTSKRTTGPRRSVDGERELTTKISPPSSWSNTSPIPINNPTANPDHSLLSASSSASGSYTQSHNFSVLSDITSVSPNNSLTHRNSNINGANMSQNSQLDQMEAGVTNPIVRQLVNVVQQGEENSNSSHVSEDIREGVLNLDNIVNNPLNAKDLNDSLVLHQLHESEYEEDEEHGYLEEEEQSVDSKEYIEDDGRNNDDDDDSSSDENDEEDDDLLNSPL
eukprot:gene5138-5504_t